MAFSIRANQADLSIFSKNWVWFLLWGIALVIIGIVAISAVELTTVISVITLGVLLMIGGFIVIVDSFSFWWGKGSAFALHLIMGALYLITGLLLIQNPILGSLSITLFLGIFYLLLGIIRLIFSVSYRIPRWGWNFFNGLISALLGILILAHWPNSSLIIIGLFVGIDLLFCGWAYIMEAIAAKSFAESAK